MNICECMRVPMCLLLLCIYLNIFRLLNSLRQKVAVIFYVRMHSPRQSVSAQLKPFEFVYVFSSSIVCRLYVSNVQRLCHKTNEPNQSKSKWIIFICLSILYKHKIRTIIFSAQCFRFCLFAIVIVIIVVPLDLAISINKNCNCCLRRAAGEWSFSKLTYVGFVFVFVPNGFSLLLFNRCSSNRQRL